MRRQRRGEPAGHAVTTVGLSRCPHNVLANRVPDSDVSNDECKRAGIEAINVHAVIRLRRIIAPDMDVPARRPRHLRTG